MRTTMMTSSTRTRTRWRSRAPILRLAGRMSILGPGLSGSMLFSSQFAASL